MINKCDLKKLQEGTMLIYNPVDKSELTLKGTGFGIKPGAVAKITDLTIGVRLEFELTKFLVYAIRLNDEFAYANFDIQESIELDTSLSR